MVNGMDFTKRWYYAVAHADFDEDGILSTFIMTSQANEIDTDKETE